MCISIIWNRYLRHFRLGKIETIAKSTLQTFYLANVLNARIPLQTFSYPKFNFNGWNSSTQFRLNECFWWRYEMMCASVCIRQLSMLLTIWYGKMLDSYMVQWAHLWICRGENYCWKHWKYWKGLNMIFQSLRKTRKPHQSRGMREEEREGVLILTYSL